MFCPYCGSQAVDGATFCVKCGKQLPNINSNNSQNLNISSTQVSTPVSPQSNSQSTQIPSIIPPQSNNLFVSSPTQYIGFSNAINSSKFKSKLSTQKIISFISAIFIIPLPFIGFILYSFFSKNMKIEEAIPVGLGVSGIFLLFYLFFALKRAFSSSWEGVVVSKFIEENSRTRTHSTSTGQYESREYYDIYVVKVQTDSGKYKRIENRSKDSYYYSYFNVGDRIKYHPSIDYYEKYDKSRDTHLLCPFCAKVNPITDEFCSCGSPIIK